MLLKVTVDGVVYDVEVEVEEDTRAPLGAIFMGGGFVPQHAATPAAAPPSDDGQGVTAPLAGSVARVLVKRGPGDRGRRRAGHPRGHEDGDRDHRPECRHRAGRARGPRATR